MPNVGFNSTADARRAAEVVRFVERQFGDYGGALQGRPDTGNQCIFAKLTSKSGTLYAWSQARPSSTGTWSVVTSGLSGTTSARPAIYLDSADTSIDLTNKFVVLVRGTYDVSGTPTPCWVIAGYIVPGGYSGSITRVDDVFWDGTDLKKTTHSETYVDGVLTTVGSSATATIDTAVGC